MYSIRKNSQKTRAKPNLALEPTEEEILNVAINDLGLSIFDWVLHSRDPDYAEVFHRAEQIAAQRKIKFTQQKEEVKC